MKVTLLPTLLLFACQFVAAQDAADVASIGTALNIENAPEFFSDDTGCQNGGPMAQKDFSDIVHSIKAIDDDVARFNSASITFRTSCLTTAQIVEVCRTFKNDPSKLEFAKFAFSACVDPANYKNV